MLAMIALFVLLSPLLMAFQPADEPFVGDPPVVPPVLITAAMFATFLLEVIKTIIRRIFLDKPDFDFPPIFYEIGVPFVVFLCQILFGYIDWAPMPEFTLSFLLQWLVGVVIALGTYYLSLRPLKAYRSAQAKIKAPLPPTGPGAG
jgi:hypothetical protein